MFIRTIAPRSYLLAVALTMVFTVVVCFVMRRQDVYKRQALTGMADRIIQVRSGRIVSNQVNEHPVPVEQIEW